MRKIKNVAKGNAHVGVQVGGHNVAEGNARVGVQRGCRYHDGRAVYYERGVEMCGYCEEPL